MLNVLLQMLWHMTLVTSEKEQFFSKYLLSSMRLSKKISNNWFPKPVFTCARLIWFS
jgi:hypothetical protein